MSSDPSSGTRVPDRTLDPSRKGEGVSCFSRHLWCPDISPGGCTSFCTQHRSECGSEWSSAPCRPQDSYPSRSVKVGSVPSSDSSGPVVTPGRRPSRTSRGPGLSHLKVRLRQRVLEVTTDPGETHPASHRVRVRVLQRQYPPLTPSLSGHWTHRTSVGGRRRVCTGTYRPLKSQGTYPTTQPSFSFGRVWAPKWAGGVRGSKSPTSDPRSSNSLSRKTRPGRRRGTEGERVC